MLDYSRVTTTPKRPIFTEQKTLKTVVYSSSESETVGTLENAQNVIPLIHILQNFYLNQKPTKGSPIATENLTPQGTLILFIKPCK